MNRSFGAWAACLVAVAGLAGCTCGRNEHPEVQGAKIPQQVLERPQATVREQRFDREGKLRESNEAIEELPLPVGLEDPTVNANSHIYMSRIPIAKIVQYFSERLNYEDLQPVGLGAIFKNARYNQVQGEKTLFQVSVLEASGKAMVEVEVTPLPPDHPLTPQEIGQKYQEELEKGL